MQWLKACAVLCAAAGAALCGTAQAGGHWSVGIGVGPVYPYPYYYPYPVAPVPYYYPPVVAAPDPPDTYVEQQSAPGAAPQSSPGTWWYCDASNTYYPYVKQCASDWRAVPATPPAPNQ